LSNSGFKLMDGVFKSSNSGISLLNHSGMFLKISLKLGNLFIFSSVGILYDAHLLVKVTQFSLKSVVFLTTLIHLSSKLFESSIEVSISSGKSHNLLVQLSNLRFSIL
jgi:hypothetical protein